MQALILVAEPPKPRKRLKELKRLIALYQREVSSLERRIAKARKTEADTPEVRDALDTASRKLDGAKEDLAALEAELSVMLGKVR